MAEAGSSNEDTRAKIVQGSFRALQEHGLPHLSYDLIAAEAGVSRQLVRYYFDAPETLMLELCDYLAGLYRQALLHSAAKLDGPQRIEMFLDFYFDLLDGVPKPQDDRVYDALMSLAAESMPIRDNLRGQYTLLGQVLSHEFQLAYPALEARASDELSYMFVCVMYGHWKMVGSLGVSPDHNRLTRGALERLIRTYVDAASPVTTDFRVWSAN